MEEAGAVGIAGAFRRVLQPAPVVHPKHRAAQRRIPQARQDPGQPAEHRGRTQTPVRPVHMRIGLNETPRRMA